MKNPVSNFLWHTNILFSKLLIRFSQTFSSISWIMFTQCCTGVLRIAGNEFSNLFIRVYQVKARSWMDICSIFIEKELTETLLLATCHYRNNEYYSKWQKIKFEYPIFNLSLYIKCYKHIIFLLVNTLVHFNGLITWLKKINSLFNHFYFIKILTFTFILLFKSRIVKVIFVIAKQNLYHFQQHYVINSVKLQCNL